MKNEYFYEKNIDENNYSIQEEGWLGILFLVGTIFFSGLLLYGFIDGQADFSVIVAYGNIDCFFWNLYPAFVPVESQGKS